MDQRKDQTKIDGHQMRIGLSTCTSPVFERMQEIIGIPGGGIDPYDDDGGQDRRHGYRERKPSRLAEFAPFFGPDIKDGGILPDQ